MGRSCSIPCTHILRCTGHTWWSVAEVLRHTEPIDSAGEYADDDDVCCRLLRARQLRRGGVPSWLRPPVPAPMQGNACQASPSSVESSFCNGVAATSHAIKHGSCICMPAKCLLCLSIYCSSFLPQIPWIEIRFSPSFCLRTCR